MCLCERERGRIGGERKRYRENERVCLSVRERERQTITWSCSIDSGSEIVEDPGHDHVVVEPDADHYHQHGVPDSWQNSAQYSTIQNSAVRYINVGSCSCPFLGYLSIVKISGFILLRKE